MLTRAGGAECVVCIVPAPHPVNRGSPRVSERRDGGARPTSRERRSHTRTIDEYRDTLPYSPPSNEREGDMGIAKQSGGGGGEGRGGDMLGVV